MNIFKTIIKDPTGNYYVQATVLAALKPNGWKYLNRIDKLKSILNTHLTEHGLSLSVECDTPQASLAEHKN